MSDEYGGDGGGGDDDDDNDDNDDDVDNSSVSYIEIAFASACILSKHSTPSNHVAVLGILTAIPPPTPHLSPPSSLTLPLPAACMRRT